MIKWMPIHFFPFWFMNCMMLISFLASSRLAFLLCSLLSASQRLTFIDFLFASIGLTNGKMDRGHWGHLLSQLCGFSLAWLHPVMEGSVSPGGHLHMTLWRFLYISALSTHLFRGTNNPVVDQVTSLLIALCWTPLSYPIWICHLFPAGGLTNVQLIRSQNKVALGAPDDWISSVHSLSCVWLCNPVDCSTPGFPVHYQHLEFTRTHVHWVSDAIQPSRCLSSPSPAFSLSQHQGLF